MERDVVREEIWWSGEASSGMSPIDCAERGMGLSKCEGWLAAGRKEGEKDGREEEERRKKEANRHQNQHE